MGLFLSCAGQVYQWQATSPRAVADYTNVSFDSSSVLHSVQSLK